MDDMSLKEKRALKQQAYFDNLQQERAIKVSRANRVVLGERQVQSANHRCVFF